MRLYRVKYHGEQKPLTFYVAAESAGDALMLARDAAVRVIRPPFDSELTFVSLVQVAARVHMHERRIG